jgi:ATP adenylyltransferase
MRDNIWAPWRGEYVAGDTKSEDTGCVFCAKFAEDNDADNYILHRGNQTALIMNIYPYNNGHIMLLHFRHIADFEALSDDETAEMAMYKKIAVTAIKKVLSPDGFNIGMNVGSAAGAGIASHLHEHIVPRWNGDTNFMPVLGETKVIPEHLRRTYDKLRAYLEKIVPNT